MNFIKSLFGQSKKEVAINNRGKTSHLNFPFETICVSGADALTECLNL